MMVSGEFSQCNWQGGWRNKVLLVLPCKILTHYGSAFSGIACGIWTWRPSPASRTSRLVSNLVTDRLICSAYVKKILVKQRVS
jgi:hypothetical protein